MHGDTSPNLADFAEIEAQPGERDRRLSGMPGLPSDRGHQPRPAGDGPATSLGVGWTLAASPLLKARLPKVVPHTVDTMLLGSAVFMAWQSGHHPFVQGWLTAKYFGLLACAYIVGVALTWNPLPWV
ncbi:MAG: SirB2 family protein [Candidatus Dechloromonas phosphoritropha]